MNKVAVVTVVSGIRGVNGHNKKEAAKLFKAAATAYGTDTDGAWSRFERVEAACSLPPDVRAVIIDKAEERYDRAGKPVRPPIKVMRVLQEGR